MTISWRANHELGVNSPLGRNRRQHIRRIHHHAAVNLVGNKIIFTNCPVTQSNTAASGRLVCHVMHRHRCTSSSENLSGAPRQSSMARPQLSSSTPATRACAAQRDTHGPAGHALLPLSSCSRPSLPLAKGEQFVLCRFGAVLRGPSAGSMGLRVGKRRRCQTR
jgi:hypothetical protein